MSEVVSPVAPLVPAPSRVYLPQLVVYVVWHPRNADGLALARALFNDLAGDPDDPTSEGVGVPVFYRTGTPGEPLPREIALAKAHHTAVVRRTAMLVANTDSYSLSEWCRDEVLLAKASRRPIYTLDATRKKVRRTFPYMYNGPSERHSGIEGSDFRPVIKGLLLEVLRVERFERQLRENPELFKIPAGQGIGVLPYPPELLTLAELRLAGNTDRIFVYPDPPVSVAEKRRLDVFAEGLELTTPVMMLTHAQRQADLNNPAPGIGGGKGVATKMTDEDLKGLVEASAKVLDQPAETAWTIGLSISDQPEVDLLRLGLGSEHVSAAAEQFALFLLAAQYRLAYGGLAGKGFTERLYELVVRFNRENFGAKQILRNYIAWHVDKLTPDEVKARYSAAAQEIAVSPPADLGIDPETTPDPKSVDFPYIRARCLTAMRQRMDKEIRARVILGGKSVGYTGTYPGLAEEVDLGIRSKKPLYLIGGFGGCARAIIDTIKGESPRTLTQEYQEEHELNAGYRDFIKAFNERALAAGNNADGGRLVEPIDYVAMVARFKAYGMAGIAAANGLSAEENESLFTTTDVKEMVFLVLKGLLEVRSGHYPGEA